MAGCGSTGARPGSAEFNPQRGRKNHKAATIDNIDIAAMTEHFKAGLPVVPIVKQLENTLDIETRRYLHWGSTTQDITDTGNALMLKNGVAHLDQTPTSVEDTLIALENTAMMMVGRTMGNQLLPSLSAIRPPSGWQNFIAIVNA